MTTPAPATDPYQRAQHPYKPTQVGPHASSHQDNGSFAPHPQAPSREQPKSSSCFQPIIDFFKKLCEFIKKIFCCTSRSVPLKDDPLVLTANDQLTEEELRFVTEVLNLCAAHGPRQRKTNQNFRITLDEITFFHELYSKYKAIYCFARANPKIAITAGCKCIQWSHLRGDMYQLYELNHSYEIPSSEEAFKSTFVSLTARLLTTQTTIKMNFNIGPIEIFHCVVQRNLSNLLVHKDALTMHPDLIGTYRTKDKITLEGDPASLRLTTNPTTSALSYPSSQEAASAQIEHLRVFLTEQPEHTYPFQEEDISFTQLITPHYTQTN